MKGGCLAVAILLAALPALALERPGEEFRVFQFSADAIPRIDGDTSDWDRVPEAYVVGTEELWEDSGKHDNVDPDNLEVRVKVGWVKGLNRLYFLYEAHDDYWDFALPGLKNDTFEVVVDADLSGGPLIDRFRVNSQELSETEAFFQLHGVHAQNYHIFTPALGKSWTMLWGTQQWLKELPYANHAYNYTFAPGEGGRLILEFYITAFDHASPRGPAYSTESELRENQLIGLCWAIIDYDDVDSTRNNGFWNLSRSHTMYGKAEELVAFRLMPMETVGDVPLKAGWEFRIVDLEDRIVAFRDQSSGEITDWHWDFGDGEESDQRNPIHQYARGGKYVVVLTVQGPGGQSRYSRVWDVTLP